MISWILLIILAYLFFSFASLGDKLVLKQAQSPRLYVFYVGVLSLLSLLFIPFVGFSIPNTATFFWIIINSLIFMAGLYALYCAVAKFEVSKVIPIVGAFQPILILVLSWISFGYAGLSTGDLVAFLLLVVASLVISFEKKLNITKDLLLISLGTSFLIALSFIMIKVVFLRLPFFQGIIWIGIFNFLGALVFLFSRSFRKEVFVSKTVFDRKTLSLVIGTQAAGGVAGLLQNSAIFLAPASSLAIINALRGIQYVFLFIISLIFYHFSPKILDEDVSKTIVIQKAFSILLILAGLAVLVLY